MGLMVSLNGVAGGVEKLYRDEPNPLNIEELKKNLEPDQGIIERDEQGNVINVIIDKEKDEKVDTKVHPPARTDIVRELEAQASFIHKKEHHLSENERLSIEKLINKYGDDYESMFRDIKLNVYQHTAAQLKKKCQKYLLENVNIKTNL
ncbi:ribosome biogenesis protein Nop16 [Gigaspora rosea]|uniref:Nucleolar protein 16 n=1 Tax=Gigaspora rosea TaxID=44941 RepID=A0A397U160_9GLOM|nr:ribosome biogenesis protein Nop16 [Gigaspora rosea]